MPELLDTIVSFLKGVGISVREGLVPEPSFLPGIRVYGGELILDRALLRWPGDLLHEAGHIAVAPAALRLTLSDGVEVLASVPHASEAEVTAWAFAAIRHLRLDPAVLFHAGGYRGHSAGLIHTFTHGVYPGAFGLAQAGMTFVGPDAVCRGVLTYPAMNLWLRP